MLRPLFLALQFLTRVPMPVSSKTHGRDAGRSLLYYPLVGLLVGLLFAALYWLLADTNDGLTAALLLFVWVLTTGGLHLDGVADSADAWVGGLGDRERTLAIMKDPHCGPAAVVALVLVLVLKFAALQAVAVAADWRALILVPLLGRTVPVALFLTTPYVRAGGLGADLAQYPPHRAGAWAVVVAVGAAALIAHDRGVWLLLTVAALFVLLRALMMRRLGGVTGDTAGATVEVVETATLVAAAIP